MLHAWDLYVLDRQWLFLHGAQPKADAQPLMPPFSRLLMRQTGWIQGVQIALVLLSIALSVTLLLTVMDGNYVK